MWQIIFNVVFVVLLIVLVFAMANQGESLERLIRGLDTARKMDAEAVRMRQAMAHDELLAHHKTLIKMLQQSEIARARTDTFIRTGKGHGPNGHG